MALTPLIASFILFSLMEFCDKTHIAVITLSMKNSPGRASSEPPPPSRARTTKGTRELLQRKYNSLLPQLNRRARIRQSHTRDLQC